MILDKCYDKEGRNLNRVSGIMITRQMKIFVVGVKSLIILNKTAPIYKRETSERMKTQRILELGVMRKHQKKSMLKPQIYDF